MKPFSDDVSSVTLAGLTIENGTSEIAIYGDLRLSADRKGLQAATELARFFAEARDRLAADPNLPDLVEAIDPSAVTTVGNPFEGR